jgi:adenine phosphoribosyltransferase
VLRERYSLEYGEDTLELRADALPFGAEVVIIDDVLATGGTLRAASKLVERSGARLLGAGVLIELEALGGRGHLHGMKQLQAVLRY